MNIKFYLKLLPIFLLSLSSCEKQTTIPVAPVIESQQYLHLAHTRTDSNPEMDSVAEGIDYSKFDMLWLGGDLAFLTSEDSLTMNHVDSVFQLGNSNTLWALGNHDYSDLDRVQAYTQRSTFYTHHKDGITFLVLDTQDSLSNIIGAQLELLTAVVDTIQKSSHLVILHHKLIWMYDNADLDFQIPYTSNGPAGDCFYCLNPNNFNKDIFPKLVEVKERGIEVICIGGDLGVYTNEFEYISPEGVYFLASGITSGKTDNKALLFHHDISSKELTWEYELLYKL